MRLERSTWKNLQREIARLPEGSRLLCHCGGFVVYRIDEGTEGVRETGVMSHTEPHCRKYEILEGELRRQGKVR